MSFAYNIVFVCLFSFFLVLSLTFLLHFLFLIAFVCLLACYVHRLVSHELCATLETSWVKYKRTCAVINTWLYVVLPLYEEIVDFSP